MRWDIEHTDTYGDQANYCWVNRHTIEVPDGARQATIVRRAKAQLGWTGLRCTVSNYGDMLDIRPRNLCQVAFVSWHDDSV